MTQLIDVNGAPLKNKYENIAGSPKFQATRNFEQIPYDSASMRDPELGAWNPWLWSTDMEMNPYRDRITARSRDLVRNSGWAAGGITTILDNVVGAAFKLNAKPDWMALQAITGNKAFDFKWAKEFGETAEALFRSWADDPGRYADSGRRLTFSQIARVALRHKIIDGDALAVMMYLPDRVKTGGAKYATAIQLVDPDRLSNPQLVFDTDVLRGGVEVDLLGAPVAYHIRKAHMGDFFDGARSLEWMRIERETDWGRPVVIHDFDSDRANQHRGGIGVFNSVIARFQMLNKYDRAELQAAILNAVLSAYVESPMDPQMIGEALGDEISGYQAGRAEYHSGNNIAIGDVRIPLLFPGEKIGQVAAERPAVQFEAFENAVLRSIAASSGLSFEQVARDYSKTNYSSARAALLESWKTLNVRRENFAKGFCSPIYASWLEEAFDNGELPLPANAPDFPDSRGQYARCGWIGPGRGWVDPVKERQGALLGIQAGFSTLEREAAEQGLDWREVLEQRKYEIETFKQLGIPLPTWANAIPGIDEAAAGDTAQDVDKKPQPQ